jgi:hypothetical protein
MLAELKDLGEKGLFSPAEIKQIIKKRTAFETALVRRIPNKNDYLRYATYEMGLEALRRKRATRLSPFSSYPPQPFFFLTTAMIKRTTKVPAVDIGLRANAPAIPNL